MNFLHYVLVLLLFFQEIHIEAQCAKVPGTVALNDSFSMKATEVTVYDYFSFIVSNDYDTTLFPTPEVLNDLPYKDLFVHLKNKNHDRFLKGKGKPPYIFYFISAKGSRMEKKKITAWLNLPISGISYEQANKFCKSLEIFHNYVVYEHDRPCYYEIRLPAANEFSALMPNLDSISGKKKLWPAFNYKNSSYGKNDLMGVASFKKNAANLFDLQGNVAEMALANGSAFGGSYAHYANTCSVDTPLTYNKPEKWLGFRYVAIIHTRKKHLSRTN